MFYLPGMEIRVPARWRHGVVEGFTVSRFEDDDDDERGWERWRWESGWIEIARIWVSAIPAERVNTLFVLDASINLHIKQTSFYGVILERMRLWIE